MNRKLIVLKKLEEWLELLQPSLRKFPKEKRFTLAQRLENTSIECIDRVIASNLEKSKRQEHLLIARIVIERLKVLVRISKKHQFIDIRHYELFSEKLIEISKMLAGWQRAR